MKKKIIYLLLLSTAIWYWRCLPNPLFEVKYSSVLYSEDGQLLSAITAVDGQWRFPLAEDVPDKFATALITFEDKRFFYHPGLDIIAVIRALNQNIKARKIVSGGSTLTMQLMRMANGNPKRTVSAKLKEVIQATRAELGYGKNEILALYAAHAPFGGNVVGLEAAAWRYFGKAKDQLTWAESAMLAVLPNAPSLLHPGKNRALLQIKRDRLLTRLWKEQKIDSLTYRLSLLEPIPEKPKELPQMANHYMHYNSEPETRSSIRFSLQERAKEVIAFHASANRQKGIFNAAVLVLDNLSGNELVYVGNTCGLDHENAVDMIQAKRSSGSILKPFLHAFAMEESMINPQELLPDIPINLDGFNPKNYHKEYAGAVPANEALARSLNVPAVGLLQRYGVERFRKKMTKLGMTTLDRSADYYGLSLILGGAEVKLWDLTQGYSSMAKQLISYQNRQGKNHRKLFSSGVIYQLFEAMQEVQRPNTEGNWETFSSSQKLAWKTGTSYGHRDAWAIGINPTYTIGVWVGNADGEGRPDIIGSIAAGSLLFDILHMLPPGDKSWFEIPHDDLRERNICQKSGMAASRHCANVVEKLIPKSNLQSPLCHYHKPILLDESGNFQVYQNCSNRPIDTSWFVLPAKMAHFYRQNNPDYFPLPPFAEDCQNKENNAPLAIIYPNEEETIYLPKGLDGEQNFTVCKAVHQKQDAILYWHLNGSYLGSTENFHEWKLRLSAGKHRLVLMDQNGNKAYRSFSILGNDLAFQ